jgi:hypothetical protein
VVIYSQSNLFSLSLYILLPVSCNLYFRHSTGNFLITHRSAGGNQNRLKLTGITSSMTSPHDWTGADDRNEDYAIKAFVTPSEYYYDILT